ncbi:PLP-dependent cysteine synthase family protein [Patescibacteria group bacterium]
MLYENVMDMIGGTPLVKINNLNPNKKVSLLAKLEGVNPGGSIKDRIVLKMINDAMEKGSLTKEQIIIEPTSGNTGIAIAMIGAVLGFDVEIVMSEAVSVERRKMISAFGASITLTEAGSGTDGAIMKARELVEENPEKYFMLDQFSNDSNIAAHYETTAEEIWRDTEGKIDYLVASVGTSGTLMGLSRKLKEYNPDIKIICAYPGAGHKIQGLKNMGDAIVPKIYNKEEIDEFIDVADEDAFEMARELAKKEGLFTGMSSGAAMWASAEVAKKIDKGVIVTIFPDRGEKYLSTELFN